MSTTDSPRRTSRPVGLTLRPESVTEKSFMESMAGFIHEVVPQVDNLIVIGSRFKKKMYILKSPFHFRHMEVVRQEKHLIQFCGLKWSRLRGSTAYLKVLVAIKLIYRCCLCSDMPQESRLEMININSSRIELYVSSF